MSDGMSEAYRGTYFKDRSKLSKKNNNKHKNKRTKIIKNYEKEQ